MACACALLSFPLYCNHQMLFLSFSLSLYTVHTDIVFSTAHKSKGLEFDTVKLTDDYSVFDEEDPRCMSHIQYICMLKVLVMIQSSEYLFM